MKFETGTHYRTRAGRKATVLLIRPTYMVVEIEGEHPPAIMTNGGNIYREPMICDMDLVAEWREPVRLRVTLVRHRVGGSVRVFESSELSGSWSEVYEVLDTFELVEGEGMGAEGDR